MKTNFTNQVHLEGYLYDHKLELRESGPNSKNPGTKFIMGTLDIATADVEDLTNIVTVHYTYVTATTKNGSANATYTTLMNIIDGNYKSIMSDGVEKAVKLRIDTSVDLNDFYTDRNGQEELVSAKRNEGGFVHVLTGAFADDPRERNKFKCDMLITGVREIEADEEKNLPAKAIVHGAVFNFRKAILPVEFSATDSGAMNYFMSLDASNTNPTFTCLWGQQISSVVKRQIVTESAFGPDEVHEITNTRRDWVLTGSSRDTQLWDDESTITAKEVTEKLAERETYLATVKQRRDEYKASQNAVPAAAKNSGGFNF